MCDINGDAGFSAKHVYKRAKHDFVAMSPKQKGSPSSGNSLTLR